MGYKINFETRSGSSGGERSKIAGNSAPIDEDAVLASRHVILRQGIVQVDGAAPSASAGEAGWSTGELDAAGFDTGPAVALGTETHVVNDAASQSPLATFVTVTWSQIVQIDE